MLNGRDARVVAGGGEVTPMRASRGPLTTRCGLSLLAKWTSDLPTRARTDHSATRSPAPAKDILFACVASVSEQTPQLEWEAKLVVPLRRQRKSPDCTGLFRLRKSRALRPALLLC